jgi:hypothetical protein
MQDTSAIVGLWNHRVIKQQKASHARDRWRDFHMYRLVQKQKFCVANIKWLKHIHNHKRTVQDIQELKINS